MSFININTRAPMNQEVAKARNLAKQAKQNVLDTAGKFQKLDQTPADKASYQDDVVMVNEGQPAELPKGGLEKIQEQFKTSEQLAAEPKKMATGYSRADQGEVVAASISVDDGAGAKEYNYDRLQDGTEVYHGPTEDGYAVVRENAAEGTLFVDLMEQPNHRRFQTALRGNFDAGPVANQTTKPQTFADAVKAVADVSKTSNSGTYQEGMAQRASVVKDLFGSLGGFFGKKN